jgi:excisionase family DNA binding protein
VSVKIPTVLAQGQQPQSADEILLDKREAARRLGKSVRTVVAWMRAKKLPYIKVGRSVLFKWSAILDRLEAFRVN